MSFLIFVNTKFINWIVLGEIKISLRIVDVLKESKEDAPG